MKRIASTLKLVLTKTSPPQLPTKRGYYFKPTYPPWHIKPKSIDMTLSQYRKNNTNQSVYRSLFTEIKSKLEDGGWKFYFTDGSKTHETTSFAVTREDGYILSHGIIPSISSVFTAEAFGILQAITTATKIRGNTMVCSDSLSVLQAISNPNNNDDLISEIMDHIIK